MTFVVLDSNNNVTGIFANPQPHLAGYAEIADDDSRLTTFITGSELIPSAQKALLKSDTTMLRIAEAISLGSTTASATDVVAWMNYRRALRDVISGKSATLPTKPAYPAGT